MLNRPLLLVFLLQGFIRRVTDSVSGLLGSSWIPGFLRSEEEVEQQADGGQRQRAASEQNHHTNHQGAGPSGYNRPVANPLQLSPRSLAAIYPEEGLLVARWERVTIVFLKVILAISIEPHRMPS